MSTTEAIQKLRAAFDAADDDEVKRLLQGIETSAVDAAQGVEDVTAGLKNKNSELIDADKARRNELSELRAKVLTMEAASKATAAGVDAEAVEKLASELAKEKFEGLEANFKGRVSRLERAAAAAEADKELLVDKLLDSHVSHELYKAEPTVDPIFFPTLKQAAMPFVIPKEGDDGVEWWRGDVPQLQILDPATKTAMPSETVGALVEEKRGGEWKALFPVKGRGGGLSSTTESTDGTLAHDAGSAAFLGQVLSSPEA